MAIRRFWCKFLTRREVCDCFDEKLANSKSICGSGTAETKAKERLLVSSVCSRPTGQNAAKPITISPLKPNLVSEETINSPCSTSWSKPFAETSSRGAADIPTATKPVASNLCKPTDTSYSLPEKREAFSSNSIKPSATPVADAQESLPSKTPEETASSESPKTSATLITSAPKSQAGSPPMKRFKKSPLTAPERTNPTLVSTARKPKAACPPLKKDVISPTTPRKLRTTSVSSFSKSKAASPSAKLDKSPSTTPRKPSATSVSSASQPRAGSPPPQNTEKSPLTTPRKTSTTFVSCASKSEAGSPSAKMDNSRWTTPRKSSTSFSSAFQPRTGSPPAKNIDKSPPTTPRKLSATSISNASKSQTVSPSAKVEKSPSTNPRKPSATLVSSAFQPRTGSPPAKKMDNSSSTTPRKPSATSISNASKSQTASPSEKVEKASAAPLRKPSAISVSRVSKPNMENCSTKIANKSPSTAPRKPSTTSVCSSSTSEAAIHSLKKFEKIPSTPSSKPKTASESVSEKLSSTPARLAKETPEKARSFTSPSSKAACEPPRPLSATKAQKYPAASAPTETRGKSSLSSSSKHKVLTSSTSAESPTSTTSMTTQKSSPERTQKKTTSTSTASTKKSSLIDSLKTPLKRIAEKTAKSIDSKAKQLGKRREKASSAKSTSSSFLTTESEKATSPKARPNSAPASCQQPFIKPIDPMAYITVQSNDFRRKLFVPGPIMVSDRVKAAMRIELTSRHSECSFVTQFVRNSLLQIAKVNPDDFTAIPYGGTGSLVIESTLKTMLGFQRSLIIMSNGKNGDRIANICKSNRINHIVIPVERKALEEAISTTDNVKGVCVVHCEASTGKVNPVKEIAEAVKEISEDLMVFVDGCTSFGAVPLEMKNIDFVVGTSSRSLHSIPGVSFVIARKEKLEKMRVPNTGKIMDITEQLKELDASKDFRFFPPTHALLAFKEALLEYADQGSLEGRANRYKQNHDILLREMERIGFKTLFKPHENPNGYLITSFAYPHNPLFIYSEFYQRLADLGCLISEQDKSIKNYFRVATMGDLTDNDVNDLIYKIRKVLEDMRIEVPLKDPKY